MSETPDEERPSLITVAGRGVISLAVFVGGWLRFIGSSLRVSIRHGLPLRIVVQQVYEIGYRSLPLTAIAAFAIGLVMALQTMFLLKKFGVMQYVAVGVGLAMTRELGPVITALMVAGRAGSGISAELGSMRVTRQIDALRVLAVDPQRYLVGTRIAACVIALPLLTAVSDILGILGGALVATTLGGVTPEGYLETTLYYVTLSDVLTGLAKTVFFALIISGTAAYYGFHTEGGTSGVGRSTTATVVVSSLMIFVSDVFMTQLLVTVGY
ncbi:MAG: ABC transporter permease [Candidatus Binatia bacterium]|nr:ABC transporter permease [Candidatus Binatia bacterium]